MNSKKYLNIKYLLSQPLFANVASLWFVQVANYIIPVLIIPFVVRALGVEAFGKASYAQNIIAYFTILVNYGFEYTATQDVAIHRNDKVATNVIFWSVIKFKSLLLLVSFVAVGFLCVFFDKANNDKLLYFYASLINIGFVIFPTWFFQGMEKMAGMALFNFFIKLLGAILTVLILSVSADYRLYVLVLSISYLIVGIVSFIYVIKKYDLWKEEKDKALTKKVIMKSFPVFVTNVFVSLYTMSGITIVGVFMNEVEVGLYAGAQKIIVVAMILSCTPFSYALFPKMSRMFSEDYERAKVFFKKILLCSVAFGVFVSICIYFFSPLVVKILLGAEFHSSVEIVRAMSILPMLVIIATITTVQGIYGLQLQRLMPFITFVSGVTSLVCCIWLVPVIGFYGAVIAWIVAQVMEILLDGVILYRKM